MAQKQKGVADAVIKAELRVLQSSFTKKLTKSLQA
jgi:hypothetical protein